MRRALTIAYLVLATMIVAAISGCSGSSQPLLVPERQDITAEQLQTVLGTDQQVTLVDVRSYGEYTAGHLPGSINRPLGDIDQWSEGMSKSLAICCICAAGSRSRQAADTLIEKGFTKVYNLLGGVNAWPGDIESGCGC